VVPSPIAAEPSSSRRRSPRVEGRPPLGRAARARPARRRSVDERLAVPLPVRRRTVVDRHHELAVDLRDGLTVVFRAYDDAVAYRLQTALDGEIRVRDEEAGFRFPSGSTAGCRSPTARAARTRTAPHELRGGLHRPAPRELGPAEAGLPAVLVAVPNGPKGRPHRGRPRRLPRDVGHGIDGRHAGAPGPLPRLPARGDGDGDAFPQAIVTKRAAHVAVTSGRRSSPGASSRSPTATPSSRRPTSFWRLGGETATGDWSWIKGGKSQSEWLWDNIPLRRPVAGRLTTPTPTGTTSRSPSASAPATSSSTPAWSKVTDVFDLTREIDVPRARERGPRPRRRRRPSGPRRSPSPARWARRSTASASGGSPGSWSDFMDRTTSRWSRSTARWRRRPRSGRLFVDFHGAFKPTGLERRFPNAITREGLVASEWNKWSEILTRSTRCLSPSSAGCGGRWTTSPAHAECAEGRLPRPRLAAMSQGTRVHQAASTSLRKPVGKDGRQPSRTTSASPTSPPPRVDPHALRSARPRRCGRDFVVTSGGGGGDVWVGP